MGLFDPPSTSIMKRVPKEVVPVLASIQALAEAEVPEEIGKKKKGCVVAMVMAAWVSAHRSRGSFSMTECNALSVITTYKNCERIAGRDTLYANLIINRLLERGMFPDGMAVGDPL